ncbi:hypothetical protein SALBM311S_07643 [Streptomyces alboniger]
MKFPFRGTNEHHFLIIELTSSIEVPAAEHWGAARVPLDECLELFVVEGVGRQGVPGFTAGPHRCSGFLSLGFVPV